MSNIPGSYNLIQQESLQFNNPVSENSLTVMGASINALISAVLPPGSIIHSMLTEVQFQGYVNSTDWVLADGRGVPGSAYATLTGNANIPDLRGIFLRGKDDGRGISPQGNLALGTLQTSTFTAHNHEVNDPGHNHGVHAYQAGNVTTLTNPVHQVIHSPANVTTQVQCLVDTGPTAISIQNAGGLETMPTNVTVNIFIRIN